MNMNEVKPTSAKTAKAIATIEELFTYLDLTEDESEALEQALHLLKMYEIWGPEE